MSFLINLTTETRRAWRRCAELGHQHNFADVLARLNVAMRIGDLIKWEGAIHMRLNPTFMNPAHDLFGPTRELFTFAPHVSEVQPKDAFVTAHQTQRIESRRLYYGFQGPKL